MTMETCLEYNRIMLYTYNNAFTQNTNSPNAMRAIMQVNKFRYSDFSILLHYY
jgi:hypothetical protein